MASSSTKAVTAAATLKLVDQGAIQLDSPLSDYYRLHPYGNNVTIRHLLNHTSGIPNPLPLRWLHSVQEHAGFDEDRALKETMQQNSKLLFHPGGKYSYSNIGYWLLGKVIEVTSGKSFCQYLRECIFAPTGITMAELDCTIPDLQRHAKGYQPKYSLLGLALYLSMDRRFVRKSEGGRLTLAPVYMNGPAYGGLVGTALGFGKFLQDQLRPKSSLFGDATKSLFFSTQKTDRGVETGMTLGWRIGRLSDELCYGKPGGRPGFRSNIRIYPGRGIASVWFINETGVRESSINRFSDVLDRNIVR
jgi:CubicO group peptidase (beta-lactamase class C family)